MFPNQNVPCERGKGYLLFLIDLSEYLMELLSLHGRIMDVEDQNKGGRADLSSRFYLWLLL